MREDLFDLINNPLSKNGEIKDALSKLDVADIAELFNETDDEMLHRLIRLTSKDTVAEVFTELDYDKQEHLLRVMSDKDIAVIVNDMFSDDAADVARELPANIVKRMLKNASENTRKDINLILQYPEDSAGSIMTTEFVDLKGDLTVEDAFKRIKRTGLHKQTIYTCYVVDAARKLQGVVSIRQLLLCERSTIISDIMDRNTIFVRTSDDQETVSKVFSKYGFLCVPVVDSEDRLVGIITVDDILRVIKEETTEDIEKMNALSPSSEPYLRTSPLKLASKRIVWLLVLMFSGIITGFLMKSFSHYLSAVLLMSLPLLMDSGGNAGAQSSTTIIRGLALSEIEVRSGGKILLKEMLIGLLCSACIAPVIVLKVIFIDGGSFFTGLVVGITLMSAMTLANMIGSMLPLGAKALKIDPAVMASPLITTLSDAGTLLIYFGVAALLLP